MQKRIKSDTVEWNDKVIAKASLSASLRIVDEKSLNERSNTPISCLFVFLQTHIDLWLTSTTNFFAEKSSFPIDMNF